ncbi:ATP-binding protein [Pseudarthrobacter sp. N5]|uniref:ATP-binding protein n=1 Tax=Pseudarthrobacter sp. N5 TaxID=3418416 RepID=UPI003CF5613C
MGNPGVRDSTPPWRTTTHDRASTLDADHLTQIRRDPAVFAPDGIQHLILEVIAYAVDEAESTTPGSCVVTLHGDGSVSVADNGRGTDTLYDADGRPIKKPVMSTRDIRFFDLRDAQILPDGHARRGMSVVAALSEWLIHTNRRSNGAWTQRYEYGVPVTDLVPIDNDTSGTTVHFLPDEALHAAAAVEAAQLRRCTTWPTLVVADIDERSGDLLGTGLPVETDVGDRSQ